MTPLVLEEPGRATLELEDWLTFVTEDEVEAEEVPVFVADELADDLVGLDDESVSTLETEDVVLVDAIVEGKVTVLDSELALVLEDDDPVLVVNELDGTLLVPADGEVPLLVADELDCDPLETDDEAGLPLDEEEVVALPATSELDCDLPES
jgi:hypothetical protein